MFHENLLWKNTSLRASHFWQNGNILKYLLKLRCSCCLKGKVLPPRKWTNVDPEKGPFWEEMSSFNHKLAGDRLDFRQVIFDSFNVDASEILQQSTWRISRLFPFMFVFVKSQLVRIPDFEQTHSKVWLNWIHDSPIWIWEPQIGWDKLANFEWLSWGHWHLPRLIYTFSFSLCTPFKTKSSCLKNGRCKNHMSVWTGILLWCSMCVFRMTGFSSKRRLSFK